MNVAPERDTMNLSIAGQQKPINQEIFDKDKEELFTVNVAKNKKSISPQPVNM